MERLLILTPIAPKTIIAPAPLAYPRLISELAPSVSIRDENININWARLQHIFMRDYYTDFDFLLLLDSDVVITNDDVEKLGAAWKMHTTPCVNTKGGETTHIITSCALMHKCDFETINYLVDMDMCPCSKMPNPFYVEGTTGYEIKEY